MKIEQQKTCTDYGDFVLIFCFCFAAGAVAGGIVATRGTDTINNGRC